MAIRTFDELLRNHTDRIGSLERRLTNSGGGGGGGGGTTVFNVESGLVLLRPTNIVGGTIQGNQVKFTNVTAVSINNIFDGSLYDDYLVEVRINPVTSGGWLRMRKAGVDTTGNVYGNQQSWNNSAGALTTVYSATSGFIFANSVGLEEKFTAHISRPFATGESCFVGIEQTIQVSDGIRQGSNRGTTTAIGYDGFTIQSASAAFSGTITVYGKSKLPGPASPDAANLWQEFRIAGSGIIPAPSSSPKWDGPVTGTLGATLDAAQNTITIPAAGTYRIIPHIGLSASNQAAANANANINGANWEPSFSYGAGGPAGAWTYDTEFVVTLNAPGTLRYYVNTAGVYNWSNLRIEKLDPVSFGTALVIQQGSTIERDARFGTPTTDQAKASLANRLVSWFNTDKGYFEIYYAPTGTSGLTAKGLVATFPAGWYPAAGSNIWGTCHMMNDQTVGAGQVRINLNTAELVGGITVGNNVMIIPVGGIYEVSCHLYIWTTTGTYRGVAAFDVTAGTVHASGTTSANWDILSVPRRSRIAAGAQIGVRTDGDAAQTMRGQNWPAIEIKYIGPPLVSG